LKLRQALAAAAKLLRARPKPLLAGAAELERARPIIEASPLTYPNLAYRGDKALMFSAAGNALLMVGRMGRSSIAMGDPVGPEVEARELARRFRHECERAKRWSVFFEVRPEHLAWYLELGLSLTQLGEEARVDLQRFDLARPELARVRQARAKLERGGCRVDAGAAAEEHAQRLAGSAFGLLREVPDRRARRMTRDGPGIGLFEAREDTEQRALAGPVGGDDPDPGARPDGERHAVEDEVRAVRLGHVAGDDTGGAGGSSRRHDGTFRSGAARGALRRAATQRSSVEVRRRRTGAASSPWSRRAR